jgi:hypothetical protein
MAGLLVSGAGVHEGKVKSALFTLPQTDPMDHRIASLVTEGFASRR